MSFFRKIASFFKKDAVLVHFDAECQEDGYVYFYSNDLKGFSLMLEPEQTKSIGAILNAIQEPLSVYARAYHNAKHAAKAKDRVEAEVDQSRFKVIDFSQTSIHSYSAKISGFCDTSC
jgi:hypothetical protein